MTHSRFCIDAMLWSIWSLMWIIVCFHMCIVLCIYIAFNIFMIYCIFTACNCTLYLVEIIFPNWPGQVDYDYYLHWSCIHIRPQLVISHSQTNWCQFVGSCEGSLFIYNTLYYQHNTNQCYCTLMIFLLLFRSCSKHYYKNLNYFILTEMPFCNIKCMYAWLFLWTRFCSHT